jgi:phospholipid/cholesterol/gamma-HCH transport system substrate-binding protein
MKLSKELKIGILGFTSLVLLYLGFNFLKGTDFFSSSSYYYAVYEDIDGLTVSQPVVINGFAVGRVNDIKILQDRNNKILVKLQIRNDIAMKKGSKALLKDNGLIAGKMIEILLTTASEVHPSGDTLLAAAQNGMLAGVMDQATPIIQKTDSLMSKVNRLLDDFNGLGTSLKSTVDTYKQLGGKMDGLMVENRSNLTGITRNLRDLTGSLVETEKGFKPIVKKLDSFADSLSQAKLKETVEHANNSVKQLEALLAKINKGEGTMGALVHNDSLYNNLTNLSANLDKLLIDLRKNPKRYVKISVF